jgi:F-type H+-transporting ATPase subunit alpha
MLGRVVNPLGQPLDGLGSIEATHRRPIEFKAPGIMERQPVNEPVQTGLMAIDAMVPIGRGQRELIIGDRKTGKTSIAIDAIINQRDTDIVCIYVAIGQKASTVAAIRETLSRHGVLDKTVIVSATAADSAPLQYIAPMAGAAIGEFFMYNDENGNPADASHPGGHVLVVYDDLSKQAVAYRQMSLTLHRPPGREAFPGAIFYLHSRLLERAVKMSDENGGGSMTALPLIETQEGDVSAYIPTNVISITDGQIYLQSNLFFQGQRPAVDVGISVSRVGGSAQLAAMKQVAGTLRLDLASYREKQAFSQFGSDLDETTQYQLNHGAHMMELLKQKRYAALDVADQVIAIFAAKENYLDDLDLSYVVPFRNGLGPFMAANHPHTRDKVREGRLSAETEERLRKDIEEYKAQFVAKNKLAIATEESEEEPVPGFTD